MTKEKFDTLAAKDGFASSDNEYGDYEPERYIAAYYTSLHTPDDTSGALSLPPRDASSYSPSLEHVSL